MIKITEIRSSAALFVPRFAAVRLSTACGAVRFKKKREYLFLHHF
ncbi:TPA: hypothetical protein ACM28A_004171 [Escherichia coli]|nr:hypothetical protein [Salmonella enterica]